MLRTAKLTSPMSVGTWILSTYGPIAGVAAAAELVDMLPERRVPALFRLVSAVGRPAGFVAALTAPPVAAYTAVLLSDTATPSWHEAYRELPFVFVGSAAAAAGGVGMLAVPPDQAGPARRMAVVSGAALVAGSVCTRFGIFEAGQQSARDPKYTVVPQRERLDRGGTDPLPGLISTGRPPGARTEHRSHGASR